MIPAKTALNLPAGLLLVAIAALILSGCWAYVNKDALRTFESRNSLITITVYPTNVVKGEAISHDTSLSDKVVWFLDEENLALPELGEANFSYAFELISNQAKMSKRSAEAFAGQVKSDNIQSDYALLVEILCNSAETRVTAISYYLVEKSGRIADGCLANSDWEAFRKANPTNRKEAMPVILDLIKSRWQENNPGSGL
jgi:hypothetical protein